MTLDAGSDGWYYSQEEGDEAHEMSLFQANDSYQHAAQRDAFEYFFSWYLKTINFVVRFVNLPVNNFLFYKIG